ncbi:glycosyltransferase [Yersinia enterocolitica]|uniref:glycosyltransferase n=1 Tax=Yersinia enterocolitica TaxID=630 RepID=UPI00065A9001|nr:glycosyltransferase [Yersinia enterocolitica]PNM16604.1 glycosyl transferase [Yersinia enterocolitica]CRY41732.1 glycosyl transferase family protein [Yersinia enterocolitica]HDL6511883.1 glycosyltransferase [Yersinia enterocolitica]HDL8434752.1 glycosyltransferase [Yersinia enterocolitica]HDL8467961.1 glycosyltransferase [Yersinia enterocolitica]
MGYIQVSVIIPVFNSEKYLPALFGSLQQQKDVFFEVIAINDGSTDSSLELLKHYELLIPNMMVINQRNMGLSCARNAGIKQAQGKWIMFMDSDDILMPNTIVAWLNYAENNQLDVLIGNGFRFNSFPEDMGKIPITSFQPYGDIITGKQWIEYAVINNEWPHYVWLQMIKLDILKTKGLRFIAGQLHEDILWTTRLALVAKRVGFHKEPLYGYRKNNNSIINTLSQEVIFRRIECYINIINEFVIVSNEYESEPKLYKALLRQANRESGHFRGLLKNVLFDKVKQRQFAIKFLQLNIFHRLLVGAYGVGDVWIVVRLYLTLLYLSFRKL